MEAVCITTFNKHIWYLGFLLPFPIQGIHGSCVPVFSTYVLALILSPALKC